APAPSPAGRTPWESPFPGRVAAGRRSLAIGTGAIRRPTDLTTTLLFAVTYRLAAWPQTLPSVEFFPSYDPASKSFAPLATRPMEPTRSASTLRQSLLS